MTNNTNPVRALIGQWRDAAEFFRGDAGSDIRETLRACARELEAALAQQPANDEVVFIDGVGAGRSSVKSCRDGVQWVVVGDRVYWPLSDSDAKRLRSACCGNGSFDGPATTPAAVDEEE